MSERQSLRDPTLSVSEGRISGIKPVFTNRDHLGKLRVSVHDNNDRTKDYALESPIEFRRLEIADTLTQPLDFVAGCFSRYDWTRDQVEALEINDTQQTINVKIGYCADGGPTNKEWNLMYLIAMSTIFYFYLLDDESIRPELDLGKQSTHPIVKKFMSCINVDIPAYLISQPGDYKFVG